MLELFFIFLCLYGAASCIVYAVLRVLGEHDYHGDIGDHIMILIASLIFAPIVAVATYFRR